jgi:hypothetical protein
VRLAGALTGCIRTMHFAITLKRRKAANFTEITIFETPIL